MAASSYAFPRAIIVWECYAIRPVAFASLSRSPSSIGDRRQELLIVNRLIGEPPSRRRACFIVVQPTAPVLEVQGQPELETQIRDTHTEMVPARLVKWLRGDPDYSAALPSRRLARTHRRSRSQA
jgi:hypothetical protein